MALASKWLQDLSKLNPFSYAVDASRMLFAGNYGNVEIAEGYVIITLFAVGMFWWSTKSQGNVVG
jgi:ABC-2 type transport system permease protein